MRDHSAASNLTENEASCCSQWTAFRGERILTSKESFSINNSLEYNAIEGIVPGDPVTEPQISISSLRIYDAASCEFCAAGLDSMDYDDWNVRA